MSWIQENKFVAGLIGVTAVVGGAVLYFGNSQGNAYNEKMQKYEELKGQYGQLEKSVPYPNKENLKEREAGIQKYRKTIEEVRAGLSAYRPEELTKLSSEQFGDIRVKTTNALREAFGNTSLPEGCDFGFEKYSSESAKSAATPQLNYQLGATAWLLTKLAETKPAALLNIKREPLPVELGKPAAAPQPRRGRPSRGNNKPKAAAGDKPYELMPMELTFTATESSVRAFLKEMVNSEEYFYAIRSVRVRNEKQTAPTEKDANFPTSSGGADGGAVVPDPFGGFPDVGDSGDAGEDSNPDAGDGEGATPAAPAQPAPKVGERILKQVLGSEKLSVHIVFDIIFLKPLEPAAATSK